MRYGRMYEENDGYAAVAGFLREIGVSVPAIYGHDPERRLILMEDLGDADLYALRDAPWEFRRGLYEKTLALAAKMHAFPPDRLPAGLRLMPGFDANLYRWERDYFREECVRNVCRIELSAGEDEALEAELSALAGRLIETPPFAGPPRPPVAERDDPRRRTGPHRFPGDASREPLLRPRIAPLGSLCRVSARGAGRPPAILS